MKKRLLAYGSLGCLFLVCILLISLSVGSSSLPIMEVWQIILTKLWSFAGLHGGETTALSSEETIVLRVRLPRVVLAILTGAALAMAGAGFQGVLRNPLADPYTLGVATGASVGAAAVILFGLQAWIGLWTIPIVAFITGMMALFIVFRLAQSGGKLRAETMILAGIVVQAFLGAFVSFMVTVSNKTMNEIVFWMMGSLVMRGWEYSLVLVPYLLVGIVVLVYLSRRLNILALGEKHAASSGIAVERTKLVVLSVSALMTAAAVSVTGVLGFVGLIVPHLVRMIVGSDYRLIVPLSALTGGIYVLLADTIARTALSPREIPLGIITALLGAPFFAYLLQKHKSERM